MKTGYQGVPLTDEPERCSVCGDEEYEMQTTWRGLLCSSCTRKCAICGDWTLDEEVWEDVNGDVAHRDCVREDSQIRAERAADAMWDHRISEWKDGDRAINGRYRGER